MEGITGMFTGAYNVMQIEFTLLGYTLSFWDIFIWSAIATVAGVLIVKFLSN